MPGVAFSIDPDTGKPYSVLNYHNGIGEELVSGNTSGKTVKILNSAKTQYIFSDLHRKIKHTLDYLTKSLGQKFIDIEFAYDGNTLYLLQVRPITKLPSSFVGINEVTKKYTDYISSIIQNNGKVFGNMIDINPEELIGNEPILVQTFFSLIFPESSLTEFRSDVGYKGTKNFLKFIGNKPYIDLKENLNSFLPNTLIQEETKIFENYYINLVKNNPSLQNQLDSLLYPNSIDIVVDILDTVSIDSKLKEKIINKFKIFFSDLIPKFEKLTGDYSKIEKELLNDIGAKNFLDLLMIDDFSGTIEELLLLIKKSTYYFTAFARIFFFSSNRLEDENHQYFKDNIYQTLIKKELRDNSIDAITYKISKGFNFLDLLDQTIHFNHSEISQASFGNENQARMIDISKVGRENIKFLFMNLFRILGKKIEKELEKNGLKKEEIEFVPFDKLLEFFKSEIGQTKLNYYQKRGQLRASILNSLEVSQVIFDGNTLVESQKFSDKGFFIGNGILEGELYYINNLDDFKQEDYIGKIILIENATPEIDLYLDKVAGVITKNGGPLAHIAIRARELGIPSVVGSSYYEKLLFEKPKNIILDFENEKIDLLP